MCRPASAPIQPVARTKRSLVRDMFTAIAPRYDLLNHALSLNIDRRWRRLAVDRLGWQRAPKGRYLDLCAGTFDMAAELVRRSGFQGKLIAADLVLEMVRRGCRKVPEVRAVVADALHLPFRSADFDGCTVGFGLRNLEDIDAGLAEIERVLKPGSTIVILEFSTPKRWPIRPMYLFYFRRVLPLIGRLVSKHMTAYSYLPNSVAQFPGDERLVERLGAHGFGGVEQLNLTSGVASLYWGYAKGVRDASDL